MNLCNVKFIYNFFLITRQSLNVLYVSLNEKARRIINSPFCRQCPEEDSGRTREVIVVKYVVRQGEPVEFLSLTLLVLDDWTGAHRTKKLM